MRVEKLAMSRLPLCLTVPDASQFARAVGQALKTRHAADIQPGRTQEAAKAVGDSMIEGRFSTRRYARQRLGELPTGSKV